MVIMHIKHKPQKFLSDFWGFDFADRANKHRPQRGQPVMNVRPVAAEQNVRLAYLLNLVLHIINIVIGNVEAA